MMEESKKHPSNMLTAEELLRNKGIKCVAWDEFERSTKVLPKTGKKVFEPNDSWLQNMQIAKGIKTCKELMSIERVDRISQLAIAEWLPEQRRAQVKKYSGQDWSNFGLEKNNTLYLIPEEALFLLEANCLELIWNNVPLSIQQAYELLIDNVECSMEEYRVYNQLVRHGYRIQRFVYEKSERSTKLDEPVIIKRKVIVDPENGLRMMDTQQQSQSSVNTHDQMIKNVQQQTGGDINDSDRETCRTKAALEDSNVENDIQKLIENLLCQVESTETQCTKNASRNTMTNLQKSDSNSATVRINGDKRKRSSKIEIISRETLLGAIKVVKETANVSMNESISIANWRAPRIQRNVKLLPKRTDKVSSVDASTSDPSVGNLESCSEKRKASELLNEDSQTKKLRDEIIELSDDEIQEVPRPMTRMELLNLIPNIASQSTITVKISKGYIPHTIKPQRNVYHYENSKLRNLQEQDKKLRSEKPGECCNNTFDHDNSSTSQIVRRNASVPSVNQNQTSNIHDAFMREYYPMGRGQCTNFSSSYMFNRFPFSFNQTAYWHHRNTMFQNVFVALENRGGDFQQNRFLSIQMNNFALPNIGNNIMRSPFIRNHFRHTFHQNFVPQRKMYQHRIVEDMSIHCSIARNLSYLEPRQRYSTRDHHRTVNTSPNSNSEMCQSSFKALPGVSSWTELKTKWREEKTITIDDEDGTERDETNDYNEVQVVEQFTNSLVGPKNVNNLTEVFNRLKIIKSAPEKTVRRRKSKYKISYNVYSGTQHYRKATPGLPLYRVIVIRQKDDPFLQPIELHRLQQDAQNSPIVLACVSMSISYIQVGFVSVPNLT